LNTCPLVWGLLHGPQQGKFDLRFELPSACARSLEAGEVAIGLVPVIEAFRQGLERVADVGIVSDGEVRSIFLLHTKPIQEIHSLALDKSSRTSVALAKILLAERYGILPSERESAPDASEMLRNADAALLIGDPALRLDLSGEFQVLDLGAEWKAMTGLPMIYAIWACRPEQAQSGTCAIFAESYQYGRDRIEEIIECEAGKRQITAALARRYLTRHIKYDISFDALQGLREFERLSRHYGLV